MPNKLTGFVAAVGFVTIILFLTKVPSLTRLDQYDIPIPTATVTPVKAKVQKTTIAVPLIPTTTSSIKTFSFIIPTPAGEYDNRMILGNEGELLAPSSWRNLTYATNLDSKRNGRRENCNEVCSVMEEAFDILVATLGDVSSLSDDSFSK